MFIIPLIPGFIMFGFTIPFICIPLFIPFMPSPMPLCCMLFIPIIPCMPAMGLICPSLPIMPLPEPDMLLTSPFPLFSIIA